MQFDVEKSVPGNDDINDTFYVAKYISDVEEIFKDADLEFDPSFPPMVKWTCNHPKEQIAGNPNYGVLIRA